MKAKNLPNNVYPLKIKEKILEAKDSATFILEPLPEHKSLFQYKPAQFLTFYFEMKEKRILRSYSLSCCPLLNEQLKTTVKRVPSGVVSNYMIDQLKKGDTLYSRKPAGKFFKPPTDLKPKHYFLFAGGSGITPLFSIIKTALLTDPKNQVTLFYANRNASSVIYQKELNTWKEKYKTQFKIHSLFSRPEGGTASLTERGVASFFKGRLTKEFLETHFASLEVDHPHHLYYLCGPEGFMHTIKDFLIEKEVPTKQIQEESFLPARPSKKETISLTAKEKALLFAEKEAQSPTEKTAQQELSSSEKSKIPKWAEVVLTGKEGSSLTEGEKIKAFLNGEMIEISAKEGIPILEQLLSAGHSPPFSCLAGSCMSCMAVLKKGLIFQEERGILEEENLKNYEILTCQAKPVSSLVEVDYDHGGE